MEKYYKIAGVIYCVSGEPQAMLWDEGVLAPFKTSEDICSRRIELNVTDVLNSPEGKLVFSDTYKQVYLQGDDAYIRYEGVVDDDLSKAYMRVERKGNLSCVQIKPGCLGCKSVLRAMEIEHTSVQNFGVLFHAACIRVNGEAILFTAPSGVGKSTQAQLWCENREAELINGDRCIISQINGRYYMCGVPYCGSSRVSKNVTLPIKAVVYVSRSSQSSAQKLKGINIFRCLWEGCCVNTWNSRDVEQSIELITALAENVPVVKLSCTPDVSAVEALEICLRS